MTLQEILAAKGIKATLIALRTFPQFSREWRLFAVWCAERTPHHEQNRNALQVAKQFAHGKATHAELAAARAESWGAVRCALNEDAATAANSAADDAALAIAGNHATGPRQIAAWVKAVEDQTAELGRVLATLEQGHDAYPEPL